jgi:hypothetical protein
MSWSLEALLIVLYPALGIDTSGIQVLLAGHHALRHALAAQLVERQRASFRS